MPAHCGRNGQQLCKGGLEARVAIALPGEWSPPKPCFGQPGIRLSAPLGLCRGTCFPAFARPFPHWVQLSKKLQYPSGCQGNISPWRDVRDDRGRVLIPKVAKQHSGLVTSQGPWRMGTQTGDGREGLLSGDSAHRVTHPYYAMTLWHPSAGRWA